MASYGISVSIVENSYDVSANTTNVSVSVIGEWSYGTWNHEMTTVSITTDYGENYSYSGEYLFNPNKTTSGSAVIHTFTFDVPHEEDGTKTLTIDASYSWRSMTASATKVLSIIPHQATLISAPNFTDEANPTIKYSNTAGDAVDGLYAGIFDAEGNMSYASYRYISTTGSSYTFYLSDAERTKLRNATPNSNTLTVRFYIKTIIGINVYHHYLTKTLTIVNGNPTLAPTVVDIGSASTAFTGDGENVVINGFNYMDIKFGSSAIKGASISSQKVVCGSQSRTTDGYLENVDSNVFTFTVIDSRGNSTTQTITKTLIDYRKITCNISNTNFNTDGVISFTIGGNFWCGNIGTVENKLEVYYLLREKGGSGSYLAVSPDIDSTNNTYSIEISVSDLDYTKTYELLAYAVDSATTAESITKTLTCIPVFDWSESDFNVNVNFNMNEETVLRHNANANNLVVSSSGGAIYLRPNGTNDTSGEVKITSSGDILLNGVSLITILTNAGLMS